VPLLHHRRGAPAANHAGRALVAVVTVAASVAACSGGAAHTAAAPASATRVVTDPGRDVYLRSCARCHGSNREGKDDAPALDQTRIDGLGDQRLQMTVTLGKGRMQGFAGLTPAQLAALVAYLERP
jgi:mono/diheme cytochrome c family protein